MSAAGESWLIRGAEVIDGSGRSPFRADVLVGEGKILRLGEISFPGIRTVEGEGKWLLPGFIDTHSHSDFFLLRNPSAESKILQGVTTELAGQCGGSAFPLLGEKLERVRAQNPGLEIGWDDLDGYRRTLARGGHALNLASLTGQGNLRGSVLGYADRPATAAELSRMRGLLEKSLVQGSRGISTGMPYPPGAYTPEAELEELLRVVAGFGGIWAIHLASEGDGLLDALETTLALARRTGVRLQVSHLKAAGRKNWGKMKPALEMLAAARAEGMETVCDRYPYTAGCTDLDILLPAWAWEGGEAAELARLADPETRLRLEAEIGEKDWDGVIIASAPGTGEETLRGKSMTDLAREQGAPPGRVLLDVLARRQLRVEAFFFGMSETNMNMVMETPFCFPASDASARPLAALPGEGSPHPRAFGTFSRFLEKFVLTGKISPAQGVARITGLPAAWLGLRDRGRVAEGLAADLVLLDPARLRDRADYAQPRRPPEGIEAVLVNGIPVVREGEPTGALPGVFL